MFLIPFGHRGNPSLSAPSLPKRSPGGRTLYIALNVDTIKLMGETLCTKAPDPSLTPQQVAQTFRDQTPPQAQRMKKTSLQRQRVARASSVAPGLTVITSVSVQEDMDRMKTGAQSMLNAVYRSPYDDVPIGEAGLPVDALFAMGQNRAWQANARLQAHQSREHSWNISEIIDRMHRPGIDQP